MIPSGSAMGSSVWTGMMVLSSLAIVEYDAGLR
jgi:hypothetical protein